MSAPRLLLTAVAMAAIAAVLRVLAPAPSAILGAVEAPQALTDSAGPGALVLAAVGALAWLVWAWGALGLALTAAGALPGAAGWTARLLQRAVLPAGARRAAAVALGLGMALPGPLAATTALASTTTAGPAVPDWPTDPPAGTSAPAPDRTPPVASHLVVRGDCLWDLASDQLRTTTGRPPDASQVLGAVSAWWSANRAVIGADPDLILPGQVLTPPPAP